MTTNEDLNRLAGDLEESCRIDPENTLRQIAGEVSDELRKLATEPKSLSDGEVGKIMHGIIHDVKEGFTRERIIQFVLANANPDELGGIAGELAGQSIYHAMRGEYREL